MKQQDAGKRSIIESVVIVISILLAFAIEALWNEQLENFTESKELARLHTEFIANRDRIDRSIKSQDTVRSSTESFYNLIKDIPDATATISSPNKLILAMLFAPTFDVTTPVLDSLLLSGNLSVIEDESVLRAISGWQRSVAQVTEAEVGARDFTDTDLFPSLIKRGNIGPLLILENETSKPEVSIDEIKTEVTGMGGMTGPAGAETRGNSGVGPRGRFNDERVTIISVDNELKGIIAQRIREAGRSSTTLDDLKRSADRLIEAIEIAQE